MGSSLYLSGGVQNTSKLVKTFATANSFAVGDVVRYDVASTSYVKAQADSATNSEVVGVVSEASANSFSVVYSGEIDLTSVSTLSGFSGPVLFLTSSVAGGLTANPPSAIGSVVKPLVVRNAATNQYVVTNFLGTQIGGSSTVAIDEIQPVGTIMPFAGSAIPDSWLACDGASYAVSAYPNLYAKLQNSSGDRVPAYGYVATLIGTNVSNVLSAGDFVQYKANATTNWTGTGSPYITSNADVVGIVLSVTSTTAVIQAIPIYNNTTKNFTFNNVVVGGGGFVSGEGGNGNYRAYDSSKVFRAASLTVSSAAITHFNTPDLRGRFALGLNTTAIGEVDGDIANDTNISSISAYTLGAEGGEEKNSLPAVSVATSGSSPNVLANLTANQLNNMPPYTVVRYIIKASPYTRAALIDGLDLPYNNLLVGDLRDGSLRPGGSGEDLLFKTNNGTSGTERMRLTNAGRLGIATTTPRAMLDVTSSSATSAIISFGTSSIYGTIGNDSSSNSVYNAWTGHVWQNGGTEKLRLSLAGDLGIGTTSPGYTLDLTTNGTARLGSAIITPASTTISSTNIFTTGSGGLAIGTSTTPTAKAEIHGADGTKQGLFVNQTGTDAASVSTTLATMWTRAPVHLKMAGTATTRLLLGGVGSNVSSIQSATSSSAATSLSLQTYGGNLGIGVADPQYRVDINSPGGIDAVRIKTGQSASLLRFEDSGTSSTPQIGSAGNDLSLRTNSTERIRITQTGVGVSTVWLPSVDIFSWTRISGASTTRGFAAVSNAVTAPGIPSERYTLYLIVTNYNYDPGDGVHFKRFDNIPGNASVTFANDEGTVYSINGVVQSSTFSDTQGWRGSGSVMWFRTT